jgi:hypothetical protein
MNIITNEVGTKADVAFVLGQKAKTVNTEVELLAA